MTRALFVVVVVAAASPAYGQPAGAQAEVLFRQGRELVTAGKIPEACAAFDESQKLEPAVTTLLNLAGCREKNGQLATAWGLFLEAERQTRNATDDATQEFHQVAQTRAQKLEPRVSKLTINVPQKSQLDGLEITRDKQRVESVMWNRALPIDGGKITITAHAPGANTWTTQVEIAVEKDTKTVEIPDLRNLPRDLGSAAEPKTVSDNRQPPHDGPQDAPHGSSKLLSFAVGGGGVALLGGALGFELWGESAYSDAKAELTNDARRQSLYSTANTRRYVAEGLGVAGLAAAGAAVWLFLRASSSEPDASTTAVHVVPTGTGISIVGSY